MNRIALESFFLSSSVPRLLSAGFRRPDFRGRDHVRRMYGQFLYIARLVWRDRRNRRDRDVRPRPVEVLPNAKAAPQRKLLGRRSGGKIAAAG